MHWTPEMSTAIGRKKSGAIILVRVGDILFLWHSNYQQD